MQRFFLLLTLAALTLSAYSQEYKVETGALKVHEEFDFDAISPRKVLVWMPEGYSAKNTYPVLYMHDGQMLFDADQTWNKQAWELDRIIPKLKQQFIVVGIESNSERQANYLPQKPFEMLSEKTRDSLYNLKSGKNYLMPDKVNSDDYLLFIVKRVKPFIDKNYATKPGREHTFIGGASMGALISLYALCEYPEVFGTALGLSMPWHGVGDAANNPYEKALMRYLDKNLPKRGKHRFYVDRGNQGMDIEFAWGQQKADALFKRKKYKSPHYISAVFNAEHNEHSWQTRFGSILEWAVTGKPIPRFNAR